MIKNADTTICIINKFTFRFWVNYGLINKQLCVLLTGQGSEVLRNLYLPAFHNNDICFTDAFKTSQKESACRWAASFNSTIVVRWPKKDSQTVYCT